ncbi:glycoside hydrolase family 130 protein [Frankia sp. CNm7]|uniref:Glycoside hydrolase family 130 protein n=1 Tax=Frankia nepalensis TaxID=1836974 RepID=A0A937URQ0_9ACTN|nr:glycoside hydrolase family 130 protein [Frankia nepalensis]MBL7494976.1 glycoside hydrolase family 130 protein [Frankia nepalensis]MBL7514599.1 glycoside hydrolase family 130 protein [Frankia nepalensis]MBL7523835.1 glycoside hydrolase family 130 protein [Frankia nepalensis]MBL7633074.1 glycoside hydrolase family 130 protein [Frankia nepalensis]
MTLESELVTRHPLTLTADPDRVIAKLFLHGEEGAEARSRAGGIVDRALALTDDEVAGLVAALLDRFEPRHLDYQGALARHAAIVAPRVRAPEELSPARMLLLGACFTAEYAVEGASVTNPSAVAHPDQSGLPPGALRVVLSLRAIGEGHLSSIGFAVGVLGPGPTVRLEPRTGPLTTGREIPVAWERGRLRDLLAEHGLDDEVTHSVLDALDRSPAGGGLEPAFANMPADLLRRPQAAGILAGIRAIAGSLRGVEFPVDSALAQRVLWPTVASESNGMEDARFVRFTAPDGAVDYRATYTAYDGAEIMPRLLTSPDLRIFTSSPLTGSAAQNKGMALFPRPVGGRHLALCRSDGETTGLTASDDGLVWEPPRSVHKPRAPFELIQVGNCGAPIETPAGWLVLTHGVGPMRTYTIGALLLDLEDPSTVVAALPEPLLTPIRTEAAGYVPNVVYSCGGLVHDGRLWLPYGIGDSRVGMASVPVSALLARMTRQA